ncbi:helix-turn-helix domain-containing protein [Furfurilactobacillus siliginis]|uniref:HTH araC/xylS-type domain-containing protein n=1 Tax=Furfurilactobacillus siliginis TaxID=348151 RepID=A0A0R2L3E0_9LACO|nr:AraC family transcriptional regulator [Furfurilactobacillus siliginis]KRN96211.1 hypothetical protein IV55_GL001597 [Furfurilactobacillus siliginis]GEK27864.1 hypothetical protein LSI01_01750 [Furfurilactobacillus siliginis]
MEKNLTQIMTAAHIQQLNQLLQNFSEATGCITTLTDTAGQSICNTFGLSIFQPFNDKPMDDLNVPQNLSTHLDNHYSLSRLPIVLNHEAIAYACCGNTASSGMARSPFGPTGNSSGEHVQASVILLRLIIQREVDRYASAAPESAAPIVANNTVISFNRAPEKNVPVSNSLDRIESIKTKNKEINDALVYIEQHLNQNISLEEVAQRVYLSSFYFSKLFKKSTNMNFSDYLAAKKIKRAMVLLQDTTTPVKLISKRLGFSKTSYFSKTFKKYTNTTPSEFRKASQ